MTHPASSDSNIPADENQAPEKGHEPLFNVPPMTLFLVVMIGIVHMVQTYGPPAWDAWMMAHLAFYPASLSGQQAFDGWAAVGLFTHMVMHGGWTHSVMNGLMLLAFGAGVERVLGARRFLLFYVTCGLVAAGVQTLLEWNATAAVAMVGASGAISGLFGGILIVMQRGGLLGRGVRLLPFIVLWIVISIGAGFMGAPDALGGHQNIAWGAHVGGFLAGLVAIRFFLKQG